MIANSGHVSIKLIVIGVLVGMFLIIVEMCTGYDSSDHELKYVVNSNPSDTTVVYRHNYSIISIDSLNADTECVELAGNNSITVYLLNKQEHLEFVSKGIISETKIYAKNKTMPFVISIKNRKIVSILLHNELHESCIIDYNITSNKP